MSDAFEPRVLFADGEHETTVLYALDDGELTPVLVDTADYLRLRLWEWKWHLHASAGTSATRYPRAACGPIVRGHRRRDLYLHCLILRPRPGLVIDHINRDPLDNRRCNLRHVTAEQNNMNRRKPQRREPCPQLALFSCV